ncbi:hypothetical protein BDN70DRAFT_998576 [Pholiota conissans]|uniref:Uncharacterized protein n=1 Tax=Pholiota conissans TaxID=109636 RepID=A0A9P5YLM8_9AGAR|nr:hypothetical protein BDN70DRAFT_998576 [Pholiota conissans]
MAFHGHRSDLTFPDDDIFATSISLPQHLLRVPPITDAEILYREPFPVEYLSRYSLEALYFASESTTQWTETHLNLLPVSTSDSESYVQSHGGFTFIKELYCIACPYINSHKCQGQGQGQGQGVGTSLAATGSANTLQSYGPDPQLQRAFLHFLVRNRRFLQSLPDSTTSSIAKIKQAFEQNSLTFDHSADLDIIIQQFKAEVATLAIRRECDLKKKNATSTDKFIISAHILD